MKRILLSLSLAFSLSSRADDAPWITLFNGVDFTGWKIVALTNPAPAVVEDGAMVLRQRTNTVEHTFVASAGKYRDFILELDLKDDPGFNSGILLRCVDAPADAKVRLNGYQMKIDNTPRAWTGGVFDDFGDSWRWLHDLDGNEAGRAAFKLGEWAHVRIECIGPTIKVWVNGVPTCHLVDEKYRAGYIAFKIHSVGDKPNATRSAILLKNIRIITEQPERFAQSMDLPARRAPATPGRYDKATPPAGDVPQTTAPDRARLLVLADMGNEPDEVQQILHLLMCANELDLEGLLAVTGKHLRPEDKRPYRQVLHPELFHELIDGYARVYPNLQLHADGWQTPEHLRSVVASGQTGYGVGDVGEGKSSPGSQLIIAAATRPDPRPLHLVVNAGANTLVQALWDYRATHSPEEVKAFVAKLLVFENQAQDNAGAWICHEFPEIHWIRSIRQTRCYGGPDNQNLGPQVWQPYDYTTTGQDAWAAEHVRFNHGALGALYPQRKIFDEKLHFIEGGGTIPWMRLVSRGLTDPSEPSWGGWSGRYSRDKQLNVPSPYKDVAQEEEEFRPFQTYSEAVGEFDSWTDSVSGRKFQDVNTAIWPWRAAMWNDLQARMDWCVQPFAKANHHPRAAFNGDTSDAILKLSARPGESMRFSAVGSTDPDGDGLRFSWWFYPGAGRNPYGRDLPMEKPTEREITVTVPADAAGRELHLILEVWDQSSIVPLVDYRRAVISVPQ